jgi:hypothetical protein
MTGFSTIIDTEGPITAVAAQLVTSGGDRVERGQMMMLRLGGTTQINSLAQAVVTASMYQRCITPACTGHM